MSEPERVLTAVAESDLASAGAAVRVEFEIEHTSVDALQRAAYRLSDRLLVDLSARPGATSCAITTVEGGTPSVVLVAEFKRLVLDEVLRERIRHETAHVRNVILAHTFSALIDPDT